MFHVLLIPYPRVCLTSNVSIISVGIFRKEGETILWEIADVRPRGERVRRYYEINLVIAWSRKKSGRSVLIKELGASAAPCQRLAGFPSFLSSFFSPLFFSPFLRRSPSLSLSRSFAHRDRYRLRMCHKAWWEKMVTKRKRRTDVSDARNGRAH